MSDPKVKRNVCHMRPPSQIDSSRDSQHPQPVLHNTQLYQHAWHDQNLQVPYHRYQIRSVLQRFHPYESPVRYDEHGRPCRGEFRAPEAFHSAHHNQNVQNPHTFVQEEHYQGSPSQPSQNNHQPNSFVHEGAIGFHDQQQLTHHSRNYNQQLTPHGIHGHHGLGFHNQHDSLQAYASSSISRELSRLPLTSRQTTACERQEEGLIQKHTREDVKVMIELGNKKRIKHPGDTIMQQNPWKTNRLSLDTISEHHPVHIKPAELQIKTLPISEMLRRDATLGGYIFLCKDETMDLEIENQLFVLPARYKDSVRAITPGIPLFLYNVTRHELHGVFEAAGFGTYDTKPLHFLSKSDNDKFPAQVACRVRKRYHALAEEDFRYALSHYDGPKFILQLSVPQVLDIITLFEEQQICSQDRCNGPFSYCHRAPEGC